MSNAKKSSTWSVGRSARSEDAVFIGWQSTRFREGFALYNITATSHPLLGSTVTGKSLLELNLQVPRTPPPPAKKR